MDVPLWGWIAVLAVIVVLLVVDLVAHRDAHVVSPREAASWSALWVGLGLAFAGLVWWQWGGDYATQYLAGYLVEKTLAVDNVFVFALIFGVLAVPREHQHKVLFYGVLGALVLRGVFIAAGSVLIASAAWVLSVFGVFLVLTGVRMALTRHRHADPRNSRALRVFRRFVPTTDGYRGDRFWVVENGRRLATPLLAVLVLVEVSDVVFAVDSIPAVFAVTQEPFLVFTSNALAILGLRALYFLFADLVDRFVFLKLGLSLVLVWVGVKMLLADVVHMPTPVSLGVVATIVTVAIVASLRATRNGTRHTTRARPTPVVEPLGRGPVERETDGATAADLASVPAQAASDAAVVGPSRHSLGGSRADDEAAP